VRLSNWSHTFDLEPRPLQFRCWQLHLQLPSFAVTLHPEFIPLTESAYDIKAVERLFAFVGTISFCCRPFVSAPTIDLVLITAFVVVLDWTTVHRSSDGTPDSSISNRPGLDCRRTRSWSQPHPRWLEPGTRFQLGYGDPFPVL
jgi:hypothetical protein